MLDTPNSINNAAIADRLAATLGAGSAALMKSHGAVTVGRDIVEAFVLAVYMEENAMRQHMALQIGKPYEFSAGERKAAKEKLWTEACSSGRGTTTGPSSVTPECTRRSRSRRRSARSHRLASSSARNSGVTSGSIPNHAFQAGRP